MESTLKVPLSFMAFSKIIPVNVYNRNIQRMYKCIVDFSVDFLFRIV